METPTTFADPNPGLFPAPDVPGVLVPRRISKTAGKPTETRIHSKARVLCDYCVQLIHELGVRVAPLPRAALWRCRKAGESVQLCTGHRTLWRQEKR